jgi:hypothetical protein
MTLQTRSILAILATFVGFYGADAAQYSETKSRPVSETFIMVFPFP